MYIEHDDYESLGSLKERYEIHNWLKEKFELKRVNRKEIEEKGLVEVIDIIRFFLNGKNHKIFTIRTRSDNEPKMLSTRNDRRKEAEEFYVENWVSGKIDFTELVGFQRI